ncbi:MAG: hypothetical protein SPL96_11025 [Bacteroidales bacterium]|nr:hypothetical protein [Bacteroidales bacterium]
MSNIATTISQSRKLIELGLNPATADMKYVYFGETDYGLEIANEFDDRINKFFNAITVPAWSLSALLEVMPKPDLYRELADLWVCATLFKEGSIMGFGETAIDAAYDAITKMFDRGYLKKKGGKQ